MSEVSKLDTTRSVALARAKRQSKRTRLAARTARDRQNAHAIHAMRTRRRPPDTA